MYEINCKELTGEDCDFVAQGETAEEAKANFYKHGAESPMHQEKHQNATPEEKEAFSKKIDEHLAKQGTQSEEPKPEEPQPGEAQPEEPQSGESQPNA